jgi:putative tricarboxylic transport membrane protein
LVVDTLGFLLSTFLFLAAFMYVGRYRRHAMVWGASAIITLMAALIFMRLAYVSLPRGVPPFDAVTDFIRVMMGG